MTKPTLLVLDDETDNLDALERIFRKSYRILRANSGTEALQLLSQNPRIDVIITDQRMPQMTGVEFLEKTLTSHPNTVRILLTGYTDIDSIIAAVNQGHIFRYITKPWDTTDLINSVEQAMQYYARGEELAIKNRELEKAFQELKVLDEAKNKFMILINHELKTPLTVIQSFLGLIRETKLNEEQQTYTDRILKSSQRLQEVVDDTLILTRSFAGVLKTNKTSSSWANLIQNLANEFTEELAKKNITLQIIATPSPNLDLTKHATQTPQNLQNTQPLVLYDVTLMSRALRHLIQNAIRFSPAESTIEVQYTDTNSDLSFSIENTGPILPDEIITKTQTPFKLQAEIMNHSKGLGLGLSVVEAILLAHESQLSLINTSAPDGKTRVQASFHITLKS